MEIAFESADRSAGWWLASPARPAPLDGDERARIITASCMSRSSSYANRRRQLVDRLFHPSAGASRRSTSVDTGPNPLAWACASLRGSFTNGRCRSRFSRINFQLRELEVPPSRDKTGSRRARLRLIDRRRVIQNRKLRIGQFREIAVHADATGPLHDRASRDLVGHPRRR